MTASPLRRPPSPTARWATVTELVPAASAQRDRVPLASSVQGTLALDLRGGPDLDSQRQVDDPRVGTVNGRGGQERRPGGQHAEDVRVWAARFAQAVVEVLGGDRPLAQLVRWTTAPVHADLSRRVRILGRASPQGRLRRSVRAQVRSVHVCRPTEAVAEVSVHIRHGQRSRALAARLELRDGRWRCTALQLG